MSIGLCLHCSLDINKQSVHKQPLRGAIMIYKYGINVEIIILNYSNFPEFKLKVQNENDRKSLSLPSRRLQQPANEKAQLLLNGLT